MTAPMTLTPLQTRTEYVVQLEECAPGGFRAVYEDLEKAKAWAEAISPWGSPYIIQRVIAESVVGD